MSTDTVTLFLAFLAVAAEATTVLLVGVIVVGGLSTPAGELCHRVLDAVGRQAFSLALLVATVATAGSLYLSEIAHFVPCRLCWYQRAAMYPLVPLLVVALWRRWFAARWVVLTLAVAGGAISIWHILIERFPSLDTSTSCDPTNPCSLIWTRRLGYLTIPTMALSGFALIAVLMLIARPMD